MATRRDTVPGYLAAEPEVGRVPPSHSNAAHTSARASTGVTAPDWGPKRRQQYPGMLGSDSFDDRVVGREKAGQGLMGNVQPKHEREAYPGGSPPLPNPSAVACVY